METHATLAIKLDGATCPEEVFGGVSTPEELTRAYHKLARLVHPDTAPLALQDRAADYFARLVIWRERAEKKLAAGAWGDRKPHFDPVTLTVQGRTLTLTGILAEGLISTVYEATWDGEPDELRVVAKLVREPGTTIWSSASGRHSGRFAPRPPTRWPSASFSPGSAPTSPCRSPASRSRTPSADAATEF